MSMPEFWNNVWTANLGNHLWQSTAVALLAWLLTVGLRNNPARVRYAIWLFASIKFLIPFSFLTRLGMHWGTPAVNHGPHDFYFMIEEFSRPLRQAQVSASPAASIAPNAHALPITVGIVSGIWLAGFIVLLARWVSGWLHAMRMTRGAEAVHDGREFNALRRAERKAGHSKHLALLLAACEIEPGVFGVIRPTLLWPSGLSERLDDAHIEAIMAHEVEHVRRRDNLTAAIHAFVEALFWFHPLVRWMSRKMNEERERACDEKVVEQNAHPEAYAESILKVCAFCMEPATPCVSGISGGDLKERILRIMMRRSGAALSSTRKLALSAIAAMILVVPFGFGVLRGQTPSYAQSATSTANLPKYEVASIKPSSAEDGPFRMMMTPDGTSMSGVDVQMLLQQAFGVERDRIVDAPKWVQSNRYDIEARVSPEEAPKMDKLKMEQRREMLVPLLENRFNLKYHHEIRELPMYALVVAKGGPKLKEWTVPAALPPEAPPKPDGAGGLPRDRSGNRGMMRMSPGGLEAHGVTIDDLSHALSNFAGRTVNDKTGLKGSYEFTLNWSPDESMRTLMGGPQGGPQKGDALPDEGGPTLFTALQEQLGLKLESQKGKVDVIVIDHIDLPSQN